MKEIWRTMLFSMIVCSLFCISGAFVFAEDETEQEIDSESTVEDIQAPAEENDSDAGKVKLNSVPEQQTSENFALNRYDITYDYTEMDPEYDESVQVLVTRGEAISARSSNEFVAIAEVGYYFSNPQSITVYLRQPGTATITLTSKDGEKAYISVSVNAQLSLSSQKITFNKYEDPEYADYPYPYIMSTPRNEYEEDLYYNNEDVSPIGDIINEAYSKNKNVVKLIAEKSEYEQWDGGEGYTIVERIDAWKVIPVGCGTTTIVCKDPLGQSKEITVTVTASYMKQWIYDVTTVGTARYGNAQVTGKTLPGASVKMSIAGKTYTAKLDKKGKFKVTLPVRKIGSKVKYTIKYKGGTLVVNRKMAKPTTNAYSIQDITKKSKKIWVRVLNVHKGDIIKVKIGNKTYKYKVKKNAKNLKHTFKIKKSKAGKKITLTVYNKYNQRLDGNSSIVYYALNIKKNMTKKQCKLVPGWEHPDEVYVNGKWTTWWYDDDGDGYAIDSYLQFKKGKLKGWHY